MTRSYAREWPENLGSGKPYDELIDSDIENQMKAVIYDRMNRKDAAQKCLGDVKKGKDLYDSISSSKDATTIVDKALNL